MNLVFGICVNLLLAGFYLLIIRKFMRAFFGTGKKRKIRYVFWIIYFILQIVQGWRKPLSPQANLLVGILFVFFISMTSYYGSVKKHCIFSLFVCAVWMLVETVIGIFFIMVGLNGEKFQVAGTVISEMCMLILSAVSGHYMKGKESGDISVWYVIAVLTIPSGSIYLMHHIFLIAAKYPENFMFAIVASLLLLLLNFIIFEVYDWLTHDAEIKEKNRLYEQQLELCSRQTEERQVYDMEIRKIRHDMKSHMTVLLGMVQAKETEEASAYIHTLLDGIIEHKKEDVSRSGNIVVDSLVNYKCALAGKEGISFRADIFLPPDLPFQNVHLAIVLGNLLENAMDACRELKEGERYVEVAASYTKEVLMITVRNPCKEKRQKEQNGRFKTTKGDTWNHGIGLLSVEQAAAHYQGQVMTEYEGGIFQSVVVMYGCTGEK